MKKNYVQTRRMRRAIQRALIVALAVPSAFIGTESCSSDDTLLSPLDAGDGDARLDATLDFDASDGDPIVDSGPCGPRVVYVDAQAPDGGVECGIFQTFPCGVPPGQTIYSDCYFLLDDCAHLCPGTLYFNCHVYGDRCVDGSIVGDASDLLIECATCPNGVGRRPRGLRRARIAASSNALGRYFAEVAHLEAASVHAFSILHDELAALGAPSELLIAAKSAVRDEVRHARVTGALARRYGSDPKVPRVARTRPRALEKVLVENAIEGCVRETFGAVVAAWQASHARDPKIAAAMKRIAIDETRHAALAWGVASWGEPLLDDAGRSRVARARRRAYRQLQASLRTIPERDLVAIAGHPTATEQQTMLQTLRPMLCH